MKHINGIPSPEYIRNNFKTIDKLAFTFDDGVKLVIESATPDILADFYMYQGVDLNVKSDIGVPETANWYKHRGCPLHLEVDERVKKYSKRWFLCRLKVLLFSHEYL